MNCNIRDNLKFKAKYYYALFCNKILWLRYNLNLKLHSKRWLLVLLCCAIYAFISSYLLWFFHAGENLVEIVSLVELKSVMRLIWGMFFGSIIGTIAFSYILFVIQMNIGRMPYGLLKKFCYDSDLICSVLLIHLLSIIAITSTLVPNIEWFNLTLSIFMWCLILSIVLFFYSYDRGVFLINPINQINLVLENSTKQMNIWNKRATRSKFLIKINEKKNLGLNASYDLQKLRYFDINPHWTSELKTNIDYLVYFTRRYAKEGDYEISDQALRAIILIQKCYVDVKAKTFFSLNLFFDNPQTSDDFINSTLEHLRQNIETGIISKDERLIIQTLKALGELIKVYLCIDYSNKNNLQKYHANLTAGYLRKALTTVQPHNMIDVLIEGTRLVGKSARLIVSKGYPNDILPLIEFMGLLSLTGVFTNKFKPVTLIAMGQFSSLSYNLLLVTKCNVNFLLTEIKKQINITTKNFLTYNSTTLPYDECLNPYYSIANEQALVPLLIGLVNSITAIEKQQITFIVRNISLWAKEEYIYSKEIFLEAINKKSNFLSCIINWITEIAKILLALSDSMLCPQHFKQEIEESILDLISVYSWVPDNKEAIAFVELQHQLTESFFNIAWEAKKRGKEDITYRIRELLIKWLLKACKYETPWNTVEYCIYALTLLIISDTNDNQSDWIKIELKRHIETGTLHNKKLLDYVAREIRKTSISSYHDKISFSSIELEMNRVKNREDFNRVLREIADVLSPNTANEPIKRDFI